MMRKRFLALTLALGLCLGLAAPAGAFDMGYSGGTQILSSGNSNTMFIKTDGTLWGMGSYPLLGASSGNLQTPFGTFPSTPLKVLDGVASVSAGQDHIAVIKTDGTLWSWGNSHEGQVGSGVVWGHDVGLDYQTRVSVPTKIMDGVSAVSCGDAHTAAVKTDGTLWVWGSGEFGQLGNGKNGSAASDDSVYQGTPIKIMDHVKAVSCGGEHTAAITTDGSLWMWGDNSSGQLGNGGGANAPQPYDSSVISCQTLPVEVMDNVAAVSCGGYHTAAITTDGSLWIWGNNICGQLGDGTTANRNRPFKIMDNVRAVSCGSDFTAVIKDDNSLWIWGSNEFDRLGNGGAKTGETSMGGLQIPVYSTPMKLMDDVAAVSCGGQHGAAVKMDGSLWTWGSDMRGQLGRNITDGDVWFQQGRTVDTPIKALDGGVALPAGVEPPVPTVGGFSDVRENAYYADAVLWAVDGGVTSGTSATTFSPDNTCTTAEVLTFLWRASGSPAASGGNPYSDVPAGAYYEQAALWAGEEGLVSGSAFGGGAPCTRADAVTYLWRLAGQPSAGTADFADVPAGADFAPAVAWAVEQGVTTGTGGDRFSPDTTCTRGQIMTFLYRALA